MSTHIARYLKDFSATPRPKPPVFREQAPARAAAEPTIMLPPEPKVDVEAIRNEAFAEGRADAESEMTTRHEAELAALKEAHLVEFDKLRARFEEEYAAALAGRFATMASEVADEVAAQAAHVLAPVMNHVLTRGAVADLARLIAEGLREGEGMEMTVRGPAHLFQMLLGHFPEQAEVFKHIEADDVDLTVEFGDTILVTRMAAWADTVRKVLA